MTDSSLHIAYRLFMNGLRFQYLKQTGKPGRPQVLSLEITHHCIAEASLSIHAATTGAATMAGPVVCCCPILLWLGKKVTR